MDFLPQNFMTYLWIGVWSAISFIVLTRISQRLN